MSEKRRTHEVASSHHANCEPKWLGDSVRSANLRTPCEPDGCRFASKNRGKGLGHGDPTAADQKTKPAGSQAPCGFAGIRKNSGQSEIKAAEASSGARTANRGLRACVKRTPIRGLSVAGCCAVAPRTHFWRGRTRQFLSGICDICDCLAGLRGSKGNLESHPRRVVTFVDHERNCRPFGHEMRHPFCARFCHSSSSFLKPSQPLRILLNFVCFKRVRRSIDAGLTVWPVPWTRA